MEYLRDLGVGQRIFKGDGESARGRTKDGFVERGRWRLHSLSLLLLTGIYILIKGRWEV